MLPEPVLTGQGSTLGNVGTSKDIICTVMDINAGSSGPFEVGVEFAEPCPRFCRVSFPPADWSPRSPEANRLVHGSAHTTPTVASTATTVVIKK